MKSQRVNSPDAEGAARRGWPAHPRTGTSKEVTGFFQGIGEFVRHLEARRIERDLFEGEPIQEDDREPEHNGVGGSYSPAGGR